MGGIRRLSHGWTGPVGLRCVRPNLPLEGGVAPGTPAQCPITGHSAPHPGVAQRPGARFAVARAARETSLESMSSTAAFPEWTTPLVADACLRLGMPVRAAPAGLRPLLPEQRAQGPARPVRHYG